MPISIPSRGLIQATAAQAIAFPLTQRAAAVDAVAAYLRLLSGWGETRFAVAGNGSGVVTVPDRLSHIYCRIGGVDGTVAEARIINVLNPQDGDSLLIRRERPGSAGGWVVLDWHGTGIPPINRCTFMECRSQTLLASAATFAGNAVAVRSHYAYVIAASTDGGVSVNAQLFTVDLSDPDALVVLDTQDIGEAWLNCNLRANADGSKLWITGVLNDGALLPDRPRRIKSYDLSDPTSPALLASDDTRLMFQWQVYEPGADTYLVGLDYKIGSVTPPNAEFNFSPLWVVDGTTLAAVGSLVGRFSETSGYNDGIIICGDSAILGLQGTDAFQTDPNLPNALGSVDLSSPTAPALLWEDDGITGLAVGLLPIALLDATHFWAGGDPSVTGDGNFLYDNAVPGTINKTPMEESEEPPFGIAVVIEGVYYAVLQVSSGFSDGGSWDITNPLNTELLSRADCEVLTLNGACRVADITKDGDVVYFASVGRGADDGALYLTILTAEAA